MKNVQIRVESTNQGQNRESESKMIRNWGERMYIEMPIGFIGMHCTVFNDVKMIKKNIYLYTFKEPLFA